MLTDELYHVGTPQEYDGDPNGSGRYRQGSGKNPHQHTSTFIEQLSMYKSQGLTTNQIAKAMDMKETKLRARISYHKDMKIRDTYYACKHLKEQHPRMTNTEIAKTLGISEASVRGYLKKNEALKKDSLLSTMDILEKEIQKKGIIDVSQGTEKSAGLNQISKDKLRNACDMLELERGYTHEIIPVPQVQDFKNKTNTRVLAMPEYDRQYIKSHINEIQPFEDYMTSDNGDSWYKMKFPTLVDRKRIYVRYAEEGGTDKDGTIELRRGTPDLDLVGKQYAQVRIAVEGNQYMKGMAYMSDTVPDGYDIVYNSNKTRGTSDEKVFKPFKTTASGAIDKDNPFGAVLNNEVGQREYEDPIDGKKKLSPVNIVKPEGEWTGYRKDLPSQFLSKQEVPLIKQQLGAAIKEREIELLDISKVSNPAVKQKMLEDFGDNCDKAATELRGSALPRQATKVILPVPSLKDSECYAPQYEHGEEVVLVRYPCEGLFEVPKLKVNNHNAEGKRVVKQDSPDAIGVNPTVASQLSGADFDGDTVVVIPTKGQKIKVQDPIKDLVNFDTKAEYPGIITGYYKNGKPKYGCNIMTTDKQRNQQMGIASNLISDMTLVGADTDELVRATKYAMVVIDAKKHKLDWQKAAEDFKIAELHKKYQGSARGGASSIISRAKGELHVDEYRLTGIDAKTGERIKLPTKKTRWDSKKQEYVPITTETTKMESVKDAYDLLSDRKYNSKTGEWEKVEGKVPNPKEYVYADFANRLKKMANQARLDSIEAGKEIKEDREAAKKYAKEIESITQKLNDIKSYAPRERQAQRQASYVVRAKVESMGGDWKALQESGELSKIKEQAIAYQRARYNSKRPELKLTAKEWEAISHNACNKTLAQSVMKALTPETLRELATPASTKEIPAAKISRMKMMLANGHTAYEVSKALNISLSSIEKYRNK